MTSEKSFARDAPFPLATTASAYGGVQRRKTLDSLESGDSGVYSTEQGGRALSNDNDSESSGEEGSFFAQAERDPPSDSVEFIGGGGISEFGDGDESDDGEVDTGDAITQIGGAIGAILGASAWSDDDSDDEKTERRASIGVPPADLPVDANYQYRKDGHGRYTLVNNDTGQVFMLAHESSPIVAFLTALAAHENTARRKLGADDRVPATSSLERVPGVLGFFVQCVLRDGVRSQRPGEFRAKDGSLMTVEPYAIGEFGNHKYCTHAFEHPITGTVLDELCPASRTVSPEHRRLTARAFAGECSLADIARAEDPASDGHLQRFTLCGETCDLLEGDSGAQSDGFSSISPVEDDDSGRSAWFVLAPAYVAMYEAHRDMLSASGSLAAKVTARRVETVDRVVERLGSTALSRADVANVLAALGHVLGGDESEEARARERARVTAIEHLEKLSVHSARVKELSERCASTPNEVSTLGSFMTKLGGSALVNGVRSERLAADLAHVSDTLSTCKTFADSLVAQS